MDGSMASNVTYITSGAALIAGLTLNEWVAIVSIVLAIATFSINWYYKHKTLKVTTNKRDEG